MTRPYRSLAIAATALLLCVPPAAEVRADPGTPRSAPVALFERAPAGTSDAPAASFQRPARHAGPAQIGPVDRREQMVRRTQEALAQLGYDPGVADGELGSRTRAAIGDFQKDRGRPATGELDHRLLGELAAALTEARTAEHPSAAAVSRPEAVAAPETAAEPATRTAAPASPSEDAAPSGVSLIKPAAAAIEPTAGPDRQALLSGPRDYSLGDALGEAWLITRSLSGYLLASVGRQLAEVVE